MISAVILTLNEERNIVDCIRSLKSWCRDIVVYDSFSNDRTVQLAEMEGRDDCPQRTGLVYLVL